MFTKFLNSIFKEMYILERKIIRFFFVFMISDCIVPDSVENNTAKTICTLSLFKVVSKKEIDYNFD